MTSPTQRSGAPILWVPAALVLAALCLRVIKLTVAANWLPNFSPWMALAFTGTLLLTRRVGWWVLPLTLLMVDVVVQGSQAWTVLPQMWLVYACLGAAALFAGTLRGKAGILGSLLGVAGCSVAFYLITNTQAWLMDPGYARTLAGWIQAQTTGLPGVKPEAIYFLRNALISDLAFSAVLLLAYNGEASLRRLTQIPWLAGVGRTQPVAA